ncbi:hypothetical protein B0H63DRAFT_560239 [Podospora didyma]|uniref:Uncharacterized protein n=1 Tax=Podospora didyma TaxID=330526 RepID=A0AAE0U044_9PEZI|nr:hypothetical protein B0H63DRAFT_560239 [Podospora didyma]
MMHFSTAFLASLAAAAAHANPVHMILDARDVNVTEFLAKRDDSWCTLFASERDGTGSVTGGWCGNGPSTSCMKFWAPTRSAYYVTQSTLKLNVWTSDNCVHGCCGTQWQGPGNGWHNFYANVNQFGANSADVFW